MAEEKETPQLEYNYLSANCGLKVSALGLGTMTFGGTDVRIYILLFFKIANDLQFKLATLFDLLVANSCSAQTFWGLRRVN